jgi:ATP-dependent exoDNAse (exonuclease V) alpha subunit
LKQGAQVLFVQNDPQKRWINGTQGTVLEMTNEHIVVEKTNGRSVKVERASFSSLDADGEVLATIMNFPMVLAYAVTIHKSQGMTLDSLYTDLRRLWEPGQAYVALSRLRHSSGLFLEAWTPQSILVDPAVLHFYKQIHEHN